MVAKILDNFLEIVRHADQLLLLGCEIAHVFDFEICLEDVVLFDDQVRTHRKFLQRVQLKCPARRLGKSNNCVNQTMNISS